MVLKGTKRSLRTGNTLRNPQDRRTNKRGSVIVRHVTNAKGRQETDEADDSIIPTDAVEFSLNKKGRWNLPAVIENNIRRSATGDASVALLRRHRLNRQSDCLSVVASATALVPDVVGHRTKARRRTYCNGLNVLHNGRGKSSKETRKKKVVSTKKDLAQQKQVHTLDTIPENTPDEATPEVRYDVFYPVPATTSLRFHPKFIASGTSYSADSEQRLPVTASVKPSRGSYQRCKHVDYDDFYQDDYYDAWFYDEDDDYEDEHLVYTQDATEGELWANTYSERSVLYSDIVEQAFEVAVLYSTNSAGAASAKTRHRRVRRSKKSGGRFFYTPEAENEFDSCLEDTPSESSTESDSAASLSAEPSVIKFPHMPSVMVELAGNATCVHRLTECYGQRYSEAACSPRKIVLDITDRVQAAMRSLAVFSDTFMPSIDLTTFVVFTHICPSDQAAARPDSCSNCHDMDEHCPISSLCPSTTNVRGYDVYRVQLNMNCLAQGLSFCLQGNTKFDNVEDVLEQVLNFMMTLSPENLVRHPSLPHASALKSRLTPDFSTVAEANGWNASCVSLLDEQAHSTLPVAFPHGALQSRNITGQQEAIPDSPEDSSSSPEQRFPATDGDLLPPAKSPAEMNCLICFSEIVPGSPQGLQGTALTQCQHWFCDTCWQSHMSVAMQDNGSRKLRCPEFRCHVEVDLGTLLSLQNVRDVVLHQRRMAEVNMMRMFLCKWCPNPHCGRVVKLDASSSTTVAEPTSMSCPCGQQFCFRCHGDPHWPLSCEDLSHYRALLRKNAHLTTESDTRVEVRGKACPSCHRFIEKQGGCPAMICICGFQFWWCCRKPISTQHACPSIFPVNDLTNTTKKVVRESLGERAPLESEWFEMAVRHRSCQHPRQVRRDHKRAELLCRKLLSLYAKGVDIGVVLSLPGNKSGTQHEISASRDSDSAKRKGRRLDRRVVKTSDTSMSTTGEPSPQCIKQTGFAMIRLKVELNNVLEHTAALLHFHADSRSSVAVGKVKDTMEQLQFLVSSLDIMLGADSRRQLTQVMPWFRRLKSHAKNTLTTLTRLIRK